MPPDFIHTDFGALTWGAFAIMSAKLIITSVALAASFVGGAHLFLGAYQLTLFCLFLALTSAVYGGAALTPAGARHARVELPFVMVVFACSVAGLVVSPVWVAAGYFLHGGWDFLHHKHHVKTPVAKWFPPLCAVFDGVVGMSVLVWWARA